MLVYWILFGTIAMGALLRAPVVAPSGPPSPEGGVRPVPAPLLTAAGVVIALLVGLRFKVGADWATYQFMFAYAGYASFDQVIAYGDPGYELLNWAVQQAGGGLWLVNLIGGAIFSWGLVRLARAQDDPWLALLLAVPYLVIVVAMGYSRQAIAIGVLMAGLAAVSNGGSVLRFAAYAAVAGLFHRTAVIVFPLVAFAAPGNRLLNVAAAVVGSYALYSAYLGEHVDQLMRSYIDARYSSQGAAIRVAMDLVPAAAFLLLRRRFGFPPFADKLWRNFSLAAVVSLVLLLTTPSSTAVDRIALYLLPLQLVVLPRLPLALGMGSAGRLVIIAYAGAIQFTWLNFAAHSQYWIPYQLYPF